MGSQWSVEQRTFHLLGSISDVLTKRVRNWKLRFPRLLLWLEDRTSRINALENGERKSAKIWTHVVTVRHWENGILTAWVWEWDFSAWGIQTGPFAPCYANFIFQILQLFHFHIGGQFLLPQRANNEKRELSQLQNWTRQRGFCAWGIQTGPFAAL